MGCGYSRSYSSSYTTYTRTPEETYRDYVISVCIIFLLLMAAIIGFYHEKKVVNSNRKNKQTKASEEPSVVESVNKKDD
jgi:hypothetical protein